MKLLILAAGVGRRIGKDSNHLPKCLLKFKSTTIIDRLISQFKKYVKDIIIVTGYKSDVLFNLYGNKYKCIFYKDYHKTNNLHTLWHVRDVLDQDTIISFADVVVEDKIIEMIAKDSNNFSLLIDTSKLRDGTMFVSNKDNLLKSITSTDKKEATGNFIGISKIKKIFLKDFISAMSEMINESNNYYYTMVLNNMIKKKLKINTIDVSGKFWTEIDENSDYKKLLLNEKNIL